MANKNFIAMGLYAAAILAVLYVIDARANPAPVWTAKFTYDQGGDEIIWRIHPLRSRRVCLARIDAEIKTIKQDGGTGIVAVCIEE